MLDYAVEMYHGFLRLFRNKYKWSHKDVDDLTLRRIMRIYEEVFEDIEIEKDMIENG